MRPNTRSPIRPNLASIAQQTHREQIRLYLEDKALNQESIRVSKRLGLPYHKAYNLVYYDIFRTKPSNVSLRQAVNQYLNTHTSSKSKGFLSRFRRKRGSKS